MVHVDFATLGKLVSLGILLTSVVVGITTIHHGDLSLGLLVLLGQLQSHIPCGGHGGHEESSHLLVHKNLEVKKHG